MMGLALLVGRRKSGVKLRYGLGVVLAASGLALLAVAHDGQGILTGLRLGYGGALVAVLPHSYRTYRAAVLKRGAVPAAPSIGEEALQ